jgi:hypothetical protein
VSTSGSSNNIPGGTAGILDDPQQAASSGFDAVDTPTQPIPGDITPEQEEALVKKYWKEYDNARKFDENFRKQVAIDRKYAAGTSDLSWAVTTNLIGAFIDVLVALLYARDPDVSVKKAPQVDNTNTVPLDTFAKTLEIVISVLWRRGKLRKAARKGVRSVLSNGEGWLKCTMVAEKVPKPEMETALNDARETLGYLQAQMKLLEDPEQGDPESTEAEIIEKQTLIADLEAKLELAINKMFVIEYVPTENMQVSTDIAQIDDYTDAKWIANEIYVEKEDALARFPRITAEDAKSAKIYYQRAPKELTTRDIDNVLPQGMLTAESAQAFVTSTSTEESPAFIRVVEMWDRTDKTIRTFADGIKKWVKEPYQEPYPTSRFFPYFYFAFYEVDAQRHPQSLSWRLYKLQDEFSAARSNFRLTRERSIPGVLFNATMLDDAEAKKLSDSKHQEYTALRPSDPSTPIGNLFAAKPVAAVDMRIFDPTLILSDMERVSGVQEALSAAINGPGNPKTATEANIQQSGTNARTTSDRDALEWMLTDLAQYTAEQSIQCLQPPEAARMAGPKAFWPFGMDIEDLFTMVEIEIEGGSTGKPRAPTDQQAWATILPLIRQMIGEIEQALGSGNMPLANCLIELIKETMVRMGDESDPDRFIPQIPPPGSPGAGTPPKPIVPDVKISLAGVLDPATSAAIANPVLKVDQAAAAPPPPAPGAVPSPGIVPPAGPVAPAPGAGP